MKKLFLFVVLLLPIASFSKGEKMKFDAAMEQEVSTSLGVLTTVQDNEKGESSLLLNGKPILKHEDGSIFMSSLIQGKEKQFVVVVETSGGNACVGDYRIMEITKGYVLSKPFMECGEEFNAQTDGETLTLSFKPLIVHPEEWKKSELKKAMRTLTVYTWVNGKITKSERPK
jgi:hypothetical protein